MPIPDVGRKTRQDKSASRKDVVSLDSGAARHPSLRAGNRLLILITYAYLLVRFLTSERLCMAS